MGLNIIIKLLFITVFIFVDKKIKDKKKSFGINEVAWPTH